jgi:hypothetical protein
MAKHNGFKLFTAKGRSKTVPRESIVAFQWQNITVLNCLQLKAGQQHYQENALLRFNCKTQRFSIVYSYSQVNNSKTGMHCCVSMAKMVTRTRHNIAL